MNKKRVLIIGCGESGVAMANYCKHYYINSIVAVIDTRQNPALHYKLNTEIKFLYDADLINAINNYKPEIILVSPGLSPHFSVLKNAYNYAHENNIDIHGELWLFNQELQKLHTQLNYDYKILAITGTNGKTTTTNLTAHICNNCGLNTVVAGNISPSLMECLHTHIHNNNLPQVWVLELSSFQLHNELNFTPHAASILNITEDHLDWHIDFNEYIQDKFNIFGNNTNTVCILNRDDNYLNQYIQKYNAISFGNNTTNVANIPHNENSKLNWNLIKHNSGWWINHNNIDLIPVNSLKIRGLHNAQNAMVALALGNSIGLNIPTMLASLRSYNGENHRLELINIINDIQIYDDSKGTNVGATVAAINGLEQDIVLIAGGDGKGQSFTPLTDCFKKYVKSAHLIGKDKQKLAEICQQLGIPYFLYDSLELATINAFKQCKTGQVLLLSPACASLDMFDNYKHRAQVFIDTIILISQEFNQINGLK